MTMTIDELQSGLDEISGLIDRCSSNAPDAVDDPDAVRDAIDNLTAKATGSFRNLLCNLAEDAQALCAMMSEDRENQAPKIYAKIRSEIASAKANVSSSYASFQVARAA